MKKIIVAYWTGSEIKAVGIKHKQLYEYSVEKRNEIVDLVLAKGLEVMMYKFSDSLCIWIDDGRFRQR